MIQLQSKKPSAINHGSNWGQSAQPNRGAVAGVVAQGFLQAQGSGAQVNELEDAAVQGLTLVHISAQPQHILRDSLDGVSGSVTTHGPA
jgi:hypothetical protein